ncbi:MAG: heavy-metal-associated domain-containing protein [Chitinophagaceae bacterium]
MKKIKLILLLLAGFTTVSLAQVKKKPVETITIKTPSVQCEMCKNRVERSMAREEGVSKTVVDYKRKTTKVTYYTDRTNIENIKTAIANVGYDADDVTANNESYKKLPNCCKKPVDGGGMPKENKQ